MSNSLQIVVGVLINPNERLMSFSGSSQNAFYLYSLLKQIDAVNPLLVYNPSMLLNTEDQELENISIFGELAHRLDLFYEKYHLTALIEASAILDPHSYTIFKSNKVKIVNIVFENQYVTDQETVCHSRFLHDKTTGYNRSKRILLRENQPRDAVWVSPHFSWQKDYIKHRYNAGSVHICPYVWDDQILNHRYDKSDLFEDRDRTFQPGNPANKCVFSTDQNINVIKTSLFPFLVAQKVYESKREEIKKLFLYNSHQAVSSNGYKNSVSSYLSNFSITNEKKVVFAPPADLPEITDSAQVMLHHHFQNGLNYVLLEAASLRLPVVHNSEFMPDLGYYYRGASITDATKQLEAALRHEERDDLEAYNGQCDKVVEKFSIYNRDNITGYQTLLANLFDQDAKIILPRYVTDLEDEINYRDGYISPLF